MRDAKHSKGHTRGQCWIDKGTLQREQNKGHIRDTARVGGHLEITGMRGTPRGHRLLFV